MKQLIECINDRIVAINEMSDETLKSAIEKCYAQNTVLMRRRAKRFEAYLNDPKRIAREELNKKSPIKQKLAKIVDDVLMPLYDAYDNRKRDDAMDYVKDFVKKIKDLILSEHPKGSISLGWDEMGQFIASSRNRYSSYLSGFGKFTRKQHGGLFDTNNGVGFELTLKLADENSEEGKKLISLGLRPMVTSKICINLYKPERREKDGLFSMYWDLPYKFVPKEYYESFKGIANTIAEISGADAEKYCDYAKCNKSIKDEVFGSDLIRNHLNAHMDNDSVQGTMEKICDILKENDKNCSIEFLSNTSVTHNTNSWVGSANILGTKNTVKAILKYNGKEFQLEGASDSSGFLGKSAKIVINGKLALGASKDYYGDGIWIGGRYDKYSGLDLLDE